MKLKEYRLKLTRREIGYLLAAIEVNPVASELCRKMGTREKLKKALRVKR